MVHTFKINGTAHHYTTEELLNAWREGNDAGYGYAVGDEKDTPEEAARAEGLEQVTQIDCTGVVAAVYVFDIVVICDADGPWAVDVGDCLEK